MKAVLISIQPKMCALIANGEKTIEVRKTRPKLETPFKCYIYCTKGMTYLYKFPKKLKPNESYYTADYNKSSLIIRGSFNEEVIGEFVCDKIEEHSRLYVCEMQEQKEFNLLKNSCLSINDINNYLKCADKFYGWHISDLKIYDEPKELSEFRMNKCPNANQNEYDGDWYCENGYGENAVVDKTKQFPYDEECIYSDCPSCGGENYENEEYAFCMCNGNKPLTRPPQSWQYCEELEEK